MVNLLVKKHSVNSFTIDFLLTSKRDDTCYNELFPEFNQTEGILQPTAEQRSLIASCRCTPRTPFLNSSLSSSLLMINSPSRWPWQYSLCSKVTYISFSNPYDKQVWRLRAHRTTCKHTSSTTPLRSCVTKRGRLLPQTGTVMVTNTDISITDHTTKQRTLQFLHYH